MGEHWLATVRRLPALGAVTRLKLQRVSWSKLSTLERQDTAGDQEPSICRSPGTGSPKDSSCFIRDHMYNEHLTAIQEAVEAGKPAPESK